MSVIISDLRQRPDFFDVVADRIWQAWWKARGFALSHIAELLRENLAGPDIPIALVAHRGDVFLGTTSLIASDLDERPQYTPWVAAVWVEQDVREQGIATALIEVACVTGFSLGHARIYLCAKPPMRDFYIGLGWMPIEEGVGPLDLTVSVRERPALDAARAP